jgi:hypothetical protein
MDFEAIVLMGFPNIQWVIGFSVFDVARAKKGGEGGAA